MVVLDSSFLIGHYNRSDMHHERAAAAFEMLLSQGEPLLLPEYVLLEVVTVIGLKVGVEEAANAGNALLTSAELEFIPCSDHFLDAWELFRRQSSHALSFVDTAVVAIARATGAGRIATFDADFRGIDGIEVIPAE